MVARQVSVEHESSLNLVVATFPVYCHIVVLQSRDENTSKSIDVTLRIQCTVLKTRSLAELANNEVTIRRCRHDYQRSQLASGRLLEDNGLTDWVP
jgi:hypothetical protein